MTFKGPFQLWILWFKRQNHNKVGLQTQWTVDDPSRSCGYHKFTGLILNLTFSRLKNLPEFLEHPHTHGVCPKLNILHKPEDLCSGRVGLMNWGPSWCVWVIITKGSLLLRALTPHQTAGQFQVGGTDPSQQRFWVASGILSVFFNGSTHFCSLSNVGLEEKVSLRIPQPHILVLKAHRAHVSFRPTPKRPEMREEMGSPSPEVFHNRGDVALKDVGSGQYGW